MLCQLKVSANLVNETQKYFASSQLCCAGFFCNWEHLTVQSKFGLYNYSVIHECTGWMVIYLIYGSGKYNNKNTYALEKVRVKT